MIKDIKRQLKKNEIWLRGLLMLLFVVIYSISKFLVIGIMLFQFVTALLTDRPNVHILKFSKSLNVYIYQILQFLSFSSEHRPFPFNAWPDGSLGAADNHNVEIRRLD